MDQPQLAHFDGFQLASPQQPPEILDVIARYLSRGLDGDELL